MSAEAEVKLRTLQFEYRMMERERLKTKALLGEALEALRMTVAHLDASEARLKSVAHFESFAADTGRVTNRARAVLAKAGGK